MMNEALRNKRDWEIFIGSLPANADEKELKEYFKSKKIKVTNIRILRNDKGESKCVGFALCLSEDSVAKALQLDGERFGAKPIRINRSSSGRNDSRSNYGGGFGGGFGGDRRNDYRNDYTNSRSDYRSDYRR